MWTVQVVVRRKILNMTLVLETPIAMTGDSVTLILSMKTMALANVTAIVDFGDGSTLLLDDLSVLTHDLGTSFTSGDEILLQGNYGTDCVLVLKLRHRYLQEGSYLPNVMAYDGIGNINATLLNDVKVLVQNLLSGISVSSSGDIVGVGQTMSFSAILAVSSNFSVSQWNVHC